MPRVNYNTVVPEGTFIHDYMAAQKGLETATAYDFWCAVWVLSSTLGRSVYVDRPRIPVYLNWYVLLVAETGVTRKSTAVVRARKLLSEVTTDLEVGQTVQQLLMPPKSYQSDVIQIAAEYLPCSKLGGDADHHASVEDYRQGAVTCFA